VLEYDIYIPETSVGKSGGIDIEFDKTLVKTGVFDQNIVSCCPCTDLTKYAVDKWYTRTIVVPDSVLNTEIKSVELVQSGVKGVNEVWVRNIKVVNDGLTRFSIYDTESDDEYKFPDSLVKPDTANFSLIDFSVLPSIK
jgi:hypothetical protein